MHADHLHPGRWTIARFAHNLAVDPLSFLFWLVFFLRRKWEQIKTHKFNEAIDILSEKLQVHTKVMPLSLFCGEHLVRLLPKTTESLLLFLWNFSGVAVSCSLVAIRILLFPGARLRSCCGVVSQTETLLQSDGYLAH